MDEHLAESSVKREMIFRRQSRRIKCLILSTWVRRILFLLLIFCFLSIFVQNDTMINNLDDYEKKTGKNLANRKLQGLSERTAKKHRETESSDNKNLKKKYNETETEVSIKQIFEDVRITWDEKQTGSPTIFILSVVGQPFTERQGYFAEVQLSGWITREGKDKYMKCCIKQSSGDIVQYLGPTHTTIRKYELNAVQYSCPVRTLGDVKGVMVTTAVSKCPTITTDYMKPYISEKKKTDDSSFAICLKVLYGNVDNKLLVDWLEFYSAMEVDKIFMYTYNLTIETSNILRPFIGNGLVETRPFNFPLKDLKIHREIGMKIPLVWQDEQVVVLDCYQRLRKYKYVSIVDLDEFILPRKHANVKDMMDHLMLEYPNAAGFTMKSCIFNKYWNKFYNNSGSDAVQYVFRTSPLGDIGQVNGRVGPLNARQKNIFLPDRVDVNGMHTHEFLPTERYERLPAPADVTVVGHFRNCYPDLMAECDRRKRILDLSILNVIKTFRNGTNLYED